MFFLRNSTNAFYNLLPPGAGCHRGKRRRWRPNRGRADQPLEMRRASSLPVSVSEMRRRRKRKRKKTWRIGDRADCRCISPALTRVHWRVRKESRGRIRFQKRKLEREEEDNYCSTGREKEEWRVGGVTKRSYNAYTANFGSLA